MTGFLTKNIGWKLTSLLIAVVLWISVASEPELATFHSAPVEFKEVPENLEISSNVAETVLLEMRGSSRRLSDLRDTKSAVVLDFSRVHQPGDHTFTIDENDVSLPRGIQLVRAIPGQLRFHLERRKVQQVPVEVRFSSPPAGYSVARYQVQPPTVTVVGPESSVDKVGAAVTDPIDITAVVGEKRFRVNTFLSQPQARFQSSSQVSVQVVVKKK